MINLEDAFTLEKSTARAMQEWLNTNCLLDETTITPFARLHADWIGWADQHERFRSTPRRLAILLGFLGLKRCVIHSGKTRAYQGIAIKQGGAA